MPKKPRVFYFTLSSVMTALALTTGLAHADKPLWELGMGAGWVSLPHYRGSDQSYNWLLPVPYAVYRGKIFRASREGARAVLVDSDRLDVDISTAFSAPTQSSDNRARAGMPNLPATWELGPNLNYTLASGSAASKPWGISSWKLQLRLPVHAVGTAQRRVQGIGWTARPVINLDLDWHGWNVGVQAGALYGSRAYHQFFYGVESAFATTSRSAYQADGGFGGTRYTAGASRRVGDWWVGAFVRADSLAGARFASSPLVRQNTNISAGLAVSYIFKVSAERVAVED
jgi:MipA family protein